jgi:hypothetical protein
MVIVTAIWAVVIIGFICLASIQCLSLPGEGSILTNMVIIIWLWRGFIVTVPYAFVMVILLVANSVLPPARRR